MSIVAEEYDFVIGVDCHAATHTFCICDTTTGAIRHARQFPVTRAAFGRARCWIERHSQGRRLVVIEGRGSFGSTLTTYLGKFGLPCVEAPALPKRRRGGAGKSDEVDARIIARAALGVPTEALREPRQTHGV